MDVICDSRDHSNCTFDGCEHAAPHSEFWECTAEPCGMVEEAECISIKKMKEKRIAELQRELDQVKLELKQFLEENVCA